MTLGGWFKSYVYIPLGGNRNGTFHTIRNLIIVWALTGLWHGASWNFIFWGLYFGVIIIIERIGLSKLLDKCPAIISRAYAFILVVIGWVFFDIDGMKPAFTYLKAMFGANKVFIDGTSKYLLISNLFIIAICALFSTELIKNLYEKLLSLKSKLLTYSLPVLQLGTMIISTAFLVDATYNPFLYFRF